MKCVMIVRKLNTSLNRNIFYLSIVQASTFILPLLTFPYLVRVLGPEGFGILGFCLATMQYFVLLTDYGFNWTATQKIARNRSSKKKLTEIFWSVIFAKFFLAVISIVVLLCVCVFIPKYNDYFVVLLSFLPLILGNIFYPVWFFQGMEVMKWISLCTISSRVMILPLTFIYVHSSNDLWKAALIQSSISLLSGIIGCYLIYRKKWVGIVYFNVRMILHVLRDGWHAFLSSSAISLYTVSTTVILGFLAGPVAVGYFNAANTIRNVAQNLLNPITQAIYPRVNSLFKDRYDEAMSLIRKAIKFVGGISFLGGCLLFYLSPYIIKISVGENYEESISILRILSFLPFIIVLSNIFGVQTMLTHGYKKEFSRILLLCGGINILIIFPMVHFYSAKGAAISVLLTESIVTISMFFFLKRKKFSLF